MSVLSTPIKNDKAMQKDIFRFAATLFSENSEIYSVAESQIQLIKCIFTENSNEYLSVLEITNELLRIYKYHVPEDEIDLVIKKHKKLFQFSTVESETVYRLTEKIYEETLTLQKNNIDSYINQFIEFSKIKDAEGCKEAIHQYLYELTTSNINSYRILLFGKSVQKFQESELSVNVNFLNNEELRYVHDFIEWDNGEKNIALSNIVYSCLEYCMLVNGDKPNKLLVNSIRKRVVYLDTNILFRAIGINGQSRKQVVISFLKKCKQAKLKLIISHQTKMEFDDTISYYLSEIQQYPRGNIYPGAYEELSDYKLFSYYEDWKNEHPDLSLRFFELYIKSQYDLLIKDYDIKNDEKIPAEIYDSEDFKKKRNEYATAISKAKQDVKAAFISEDYTYSKRDIHDATVINHIELLRDKAEENKDIFLVSSDKILRYWDMARTERDYPVVIYPSQLFLVLIKMCGRSEKDFDSFVSFINVKTSHNQITAEKANVILSGISSITEDIETQKLIVSTICDGEFQNVVNESFADEELYQKVKSFSQRYLEGELKEQKEAIEVLKESAIYQKEQIDLLKQTVITQTSAIKEQQQEIDNKAQHDEEHKERICAFAEKKIKISFRLKWYVFPTIALFFALAFVVFVILQFVCCDASWNIVTKLSNYIAETTFGKNVDGYIAVIDGALFAMLGSLVFPMLWVKPWNKEKRDADKQRRLEKYIKKNKLL